MKTEYPCSLAHALAASGEQNSLLLCVCVHMYKDLPSLPPLSFCLSHAHSPKRSPRENLLDQDATNNIFKQKYPKAKEEMEEKLQVNSQLRIIVLFQRIFLSHTNSLCLFTVFTFPLTLPFFLCAIFPSLPPSSPPSLPPSLLPSLPPPLPPSRPLSPAGVSDQVLREQSPVFRLQHQLWPAPDSGVCS